MKSQNMTRGAIALLATLLVCMFASCGGNGNSGVTDLTNPESQGNERIALTVLSDSLIADESALSMRIEELPGETLVHLSLNENSGMQALYYEIDFDAASLNPVETEVADELAGESLLSLAVDSEIGKLSIGHAVPNFASKPALNASGELATLSFKHAPQTELKGGSSVPTGNSAAAPMEALAGFLLLGDSLVASVEYTNPGDYNQDGIVGINDLTPLASNFGASLEDAEIPLGFFGFTSKPAIFAVDGDGNGEINISDLTPIGANFGNDVTGGYNFYASFDESDKPVNNDDPSTIAPVATSESGTILTDGDPGEDLLNFRFIQPTTPPSEVFLWARPVDADGNEGTPSETARLVAADSLVLDIDEAGLTGAGDEDNPYEIDTAQDYQLRLIHGTDGNVTSSPEAVFMMQGIGSSTGSLGMLERREISGGDGIIRVVTRTASEIFPSVGEITDDTREMDVIDIYEGMFLVFATYGGRVANFMFCLAPDPDNLGPVAIIGVDEQNGVAPRTVTLNADASDDTDGDIAKYAWDIGDDGSIEHVSDGFSLASNIELVISEGGPLDVKLTVTDDDGAMASSTITLSSEGWQSIEIDSVASTLPADPMYQVIDGNPAVAYRRFSTLKYARASNASGTSWNTPFAVPQSVRAEHISLRDVQGRPGIAYQRALADEGIYYALGNAANATSFDKVRLTSSGMDHSPSLAIINGNPALSYAWHTGDADNAYTLLYVRSSDNLGNTGGAWDLFTAGYVWESDEFYMDKTALIEADGKPAVYCIANNDQLGLNWRSYYIKSLNVGGSSWTLLPYTLGNNDGHEAKYTPMTSIVSRPHVLAFDAVTGELTARKAENLSVTSWTDPVAVPNLGLEDAGHHASCANVAGFFSVAFYDADMQTIAYAGSKTPNIDDGFPEAGIVAQGVGEYDLDVHDGQYISLGAAQGKPVMVYQDLINESLRFATFYELP